MVCSLAGCARLLGSGLMAMVVRYPCIRPHQVWDHQLRCPERCERACLCLCCGPLPGSCSTRPPLAPMPHLCHTPSMCSQDAKLVASGVVSGN